MQTAWAHSAAAMKQSWKSNAETTKAWIWVKATSVPSIGEDSCQGNRRLQFWLNSWKWQEKTVTTQVFERNGIFVIYFMTFHPAPQSCMVLSMCLTQKVHFACVCSLPQVLCTCDRVWVWDPWIWTQCCLDLCPTITAFWKLRRGRVNTWIVFIGVEGFMGFAIESEICAQCSSYFHKP